MLKTLFFLLKLFFLSVIVVWFFKNPGTVRIEWFETVHEIPVMVAVLGVLMISIVFMLVLHVFLFFRKLPDIWRRFWEKQQEKKGYQNFTEGFAALAMDDLETAREKMIKTQTLLGESPLPLILAALAAQKANDHVSAARVYGMLLKNKSTEFLGYYGLTQTAKSQRDYPAAYLYGKRAFELSPSGKWVVISLFELSLRLKDYTEAQYFLKKIKKYNAVKKDQLRHYEAVLSFLKGMDEPDQKSKIGYFQKSFESDPSFIPAVLAFTDAAIHLERPGKAEKLLKTSLKLSPHPDVAQAYVDLYEGISSGEKMKRAENVLLYSNANYVGHLIVIQTALKEGFTGIARTHLDLALVSNEGSSPKLNFLTQQLKELDGNIIPWSSKNTLEKIVSSKADKTWQCTSCLTTYPQWDFICRECDQADAIFWKDPLNHKPSKYIISAH